MKSVRTIICFLALAGALGMASLVTMAQGNDLAVGKAKEFIQLLQKGDFQGAYSKCDSNLGFKATPETFKTYWGSLLSKAGSFVEFKSATVESKDGVMIVTQVVKFEKGHVDLKVALDDQMKIAGFVIKDHKAATPSAAAAPSGGGAPGAPQQAQGQQAAAPAPSA